MMEFSTAVQEVLAELDEDLEYPFPFKVDDRECRYRRPLPGEGVALTTAMASHIPTWQKFSATVEIVFAVIRDEDREYLQHRMLDTSDPFSRLAPRFLLGTDETDGLVHDMLEHWSGRPTEPSSSSSGSPRTTGRGSTQSTRKSNSSASRSRSS